MSEKVFGSEKKGSLRDIPLPGSKNLDLSQQEAAISSLGEATKPNQSSSIVGGYDWEQTSHYPRVPFKWIAVAIAVCLLALTYSFLSYNASLSITSIEARATVTGNYEVHYEPEDQSLISFMRVGPIKHSVDMHVAGSTEENRQTKTQGILRVFNKDSDEKRYVKNTRFQTEDGRVYLAFNHFVIPPRSSEGPGSIEIAVVAKHPGEKYNSESGLNFKLPALKEQGSPAYDTVYATQEEALLGGFSGVVTIPEKDEIAQAQNELTIKLKQNLYDQFELHTANSVTSKEASSISEVVFTQKVNKEKGGVDLFAEASIQGVAVDRQKLENFLAKANTENHDGSPVNIANLNDINITFPASLEIEKTEAFTLDVVGEAEFTWPINEDAVKKLLAGKLISHIENDLISGLGNITVTEVDVSPFWRRALPENVDKITINRE